jgi:iron complex transport system substrate-binding protein
MIRVASLLPAATEMVAALGVSSWLVGVSHECDFPPVVTLLTRLTATPIDTDLSGAAIDREVRALRADGRAVIGINALELKRLAPDLIITQELCDVCAVADGEAHRLAAVMDPPPRVLSLAGRDLEGIWRDIVAVGSALDLSRRAANLVASLRLKLALLSQRTPAGPARRVVCVEWLEPLYLAGHWVPDLVQAAGGVDVGANSGGPSSRSTWSGLAALAPDLVIVMLCGFGIERALMELSGLVDSDGIALLETTPTWVLDGNAYTSRPGPRVTVGAELIQRAMLGTEGPGLVRWRG